MYQEGFRWWNMGHAAAVAFVLFAVILVLTLVTMGLRVREPVASGVVPR
jgi:multiple sugar transport system permease protein